jgi:ribonuclease HI
MNRYITHLPKPKEKSSKMPNKATFAQNAHTAIPAQILEEIIGQFQITHSYFSSPITCHTNLKQFSSPHQRDQIFGSMGQAFDYKWQGSGYAHPPKHELTIQALHWARLAAQVDPKNQTILILTNPDWHSNKNSLENEYPNAHTIAYITPDTLKYHAHTGLAKYYKHVEPQAIKIIYIHHKTSLPIQPTKETRIQNIITQTTLIRCITKLAQPTAQNIKVKISDKWKITKDKPTISQSTQNSTQIPAYNSYKPKKYDEADNFYTDGSYIPPYKDKEGRIKGDVAGYGVYNTTMEINISKRLPGLQNIQKVELSAILETLEETKDRNEKTHIFTDSLNSIYLINTHLKHITAHNNHLDKLLLDQIRDQIIVRKHHTMIQKVKVHIEISGNEAVDVLAKQGTDKPTINLEIDFKEHYRSYTRPYMLIKQKETDKLKTKVRNLEAYLKKHQKEHQQASILSKYANIQKWNNNKINHKLSNKSWTNPNVTEKQISQVLKFRYAQYMGNHRKTIIFKNTFSNPRCTLCHTGAIDTWPHLLLTCPKSTSKKLKSEKT